MFSPRMLRALALVLATLAGIVQTSAPRSAVAAIVALHGEPKIFAVFLPGRVFHAGQTVRGSVVTSTNVGYVEARVQYRNIAMHSDSPGHFSLAYTIPWYVMFARKGAWTLQIVARSIDGVEAKEDFPITLR